MSSEQRYSFWQATLLICRNYCKSTTSTAVPVEGEVLWVGLASSERSGFELAKWRTLIRFVSQAFLDTRRLS